MLIHVNVNSKEIAMVGLVTNVLIWKKLYPGENDKSYTILKYSNMYILVYI